MKRCLALLAVCAAIGASGCEHECTCPHDDGGEAGTGEIEVEVGIAGGSDGLDFVPLMRGGDIPLNTFGQGGTHASVAIRARGLGTNVAFFDVSLENKETRAAVMTVPSSRPQLWLCDEAREVCDYVRVNVMTGGLAPPGIENRDGLEVVVTATVRDENGRRGMGSEEGVLRWMGPPLRDAGGQPDEDGGDSDFDGGSE